MITEQQHAAWNEARLLKQAIKRNADAIAATLPREMQKRLIDCERKREEAAHAVREFENESRSLLEASVSV